MNAIGRRSQTLKNRMIGARLAARLTSILLVTLTGSASLAGELSVTPASMVRVGTVDERYQSYNIEMVEITGGEFWKPYGPRRSARDSSLFEYRPPIDLTNARLRKLAAALGPAFLRVSGTWANTTYFADSDDAPLAPPAGFKVVLTGQQWRGVIDFAHAVNARIV